MTCTQPKPKYYLVYGFRVSLYNRGDIPIGICPVDEIAYSIGYVLGNIANKLDGSGVEKVKQRITLGFIRGVNKLTPKPGRPLFMIGYNLGKKASKLLSVID